MPRIYNRVVDGRKTCNTCGEVKPVEDFYPRPNRSGVTSSCRICVQEHNRKPRAFPPKDMACQNCGTIFRAEMSDRARFCTSRCGEESRRRRAGAKPLGSVVDGQKRCNTCNVWKPVADYTPRKSRGGNPISDCKPCMAARGRAYNASDRGRNRRYALKYGVTVDWYEQKLAAQDGKCAICLSVPEQRLVIDHCHVSGKARGLLCFLCNSALGRFRDDPKMLRAAANYLETA